MNRLLSAGCSRIKHETYKSLSQKSKFIDSSSGNNNGPTRSSVHFQIDSRSIHTKRLPKTPDLIYMPHITRWLTTKLKFKYLKKRWDPDFSEGAFIYGSTRAVCRITEILNSGKGEELEGLVTDSTKIKLLDDISYRLTKIQRDIILLEPIDIKILIPLSVNFETRGLEKICKIALRFLALKWHQQADEIYRLALTALQTEFSRDYGSGTKPNWTISNFSILECAILSEASSSSPKT